LADETSKSPRNNNSKVIRKGESVKKPLKGKKKKKDKEANKNNEEEHKNSPLAQILSSDEPSLKKKDKKVPESKEKKESNDSEE